MLNKALTSAARHARSLCAADAAATRASSGRDHLDRRRPCPREAHHEAWYDAKIIAVGTDGSVDIHYAGWNKKWDTRLPTGSAGS